MSQATQLLRRRSDARRVAPLPPLSDDHANYAARFTYPARRDVRRLMRSSSRLADLAIVFPGAAYAIASRHTPLELRKAAIAQVEAGEALKTVAATLGLPLWLRRLPPEAFDQPIRALPHSETFTRRIASRMPADPAHSASWLQAVTFGTRACSDDFTLWLADQSIYAEPGDPERMFGVLASYAWHSRAPQTRAHSLIVVPWRPEIAFDTALCAAKSWFSRIRLTLQLSHGAVSDPWLSGGLVRGYTFVPLLDQHEILTEARAMQNCADQYADRLASDRCRLFSIRRHGDHIATLEIGPHAREAGMLTITQLKGRHNLAAPLEVWQAAYAWLAGQTNLRRMPPRTFPDRQFDNAAWTDMLADYRAATEGAPWLPHAANPVVFDELENEMGELARRAGVSSWLFT
ncbi:PcfJ domain-containing protein [Hyphomicrobium sulfonivorans]|uniref:PcfJ domain-containing protein n=1 Tax=Hyphomicrobium sulfonivorans TaxID=121290 RepID=UPI00156D7922|nr:PcfJ domain-containing protein [Hyphomicrobium sulfonivorans]MBI1650075.1 PcfJ domain-containing protein [Hyphomicrobium sulfonivorans]NSL72992.1 hypothetical protein [Hyphomicrobium sulfonivorans]